MSILRNKIVGIDGPDSTGVNLRCSSYLAVINAFSGDDEDLGQPLKESDAVVWMNGTMLHDAAGTIRFMNALKRPTALLDEMIRCFCHQIDFSTYYSRFRFGFGDEFVYIAYHSI